MTVVKQLALKAGDQNKFDRNQTVFKEWKTPTDKDMEKMVTHDMSHWNIPRFVKDEKMVSRQATETKALIITFVLLPGSSRRSTRCSSSTLESSFI